MRRVGADSAVAVDGNAYSVPWRLIGEAVRVTVIAARVARPPWRTGGRGRVPWSGVAER
ncbi:Mu transposase domain-containing protein [Methylobacterium terricola]|uniref:Mu transposase domain-containing protein n=1 Tax=Methylobacterium terricola TaxID=2583531 RepID=UPI003CCC4D40